MNWTKRALLTFWLSAYCGNVIGGPVDGLQTYFTAIEKADKALMRNAINAPDGYKDQFVKIIDVSKGVAMLSELLNTKYDIAPADQRIPTQYLQTLQKDLLTREFKVDGDRAESIPKNATAVPVALVHIGGRWVLDLRRGQPDEDVMAQGEVLGATCDAVTALLNGLIQKIDTLDTTKFSFEEAWRMVDTQINRKVDAIIKAKGKQVSGGNSGQRR